MSNFHPPQMLQIGPNCQRAGAIQDTELPPEKNQQS